MKERIKEEVEYLKSYAATIIIGYFVARIIGETICWIINKIESP